MNKHKLAIEVRHFGLEIETSNDNDLSQRRELWRNFRTRFLYSSLLDMVELEWTHNDKVHRGVINAARTHIHTVGASMVGFYWVSECIHGHWKMCRDLGLIEFPTLRYHFQVCERNICLIYGDKKMIIHTDGKQLNVGKIDA